MNKKEREIADFVEKQIDKIACEFIKHSDSFDSEGDVVCRLFSLLSKNNELTKKYPIQLDGRESKSILLHSEASTLSKRGKKYDIAIFSPDDYQKDDYPLIAIEIKYDISLWRNRRKKRNSTPKGLLNDFQKLNNPQNEITRAYLLIFNYHHYSVDEFEKLKQYRKHYRKKFRIYNV